MIRIGLAAYQFKNHDIAFNLSQIERAMQSTQGAVDLLCFGESFLQGFDSLCWQYDKDASVAVSQDSDCMRRLCDLTVRYGADLLFGYFEKDEDSIYSSCAVIERGALTHNYRRISRGWKEPVADGHYQEGRETRDFPYRGKRFQIALCGDLWDYPERFKTDGTLIWPVYVSFELEEWAENEADYAKQAAAAASRALLVNSLSDDPKSYGGAFDMTDGRIIKKAAYGKEEVLIVEVS
ncbi:MAG: carbon-nitrogen hydrolase family protein [Ruminococcaceae bacterium]|jgi:N-carbamoylputrescine amidase|nr:carbon-nitrogen hydrolase family protein [Oscillospiraceae bacterium]